MGCSSWRFQKGGGSNECDGLRRAHGSISKKEYLD